MNNFIAWIDVSSFPDSSGSNVIEFTELAWSSIAESDESNNTKLSNVKSTVFIFETVSLTILKLLLVLEVSTNKLFEYPLNLPIFILVSNPVLLISSIIWPLESKNVNLV